MPPAREPPLAARELVEARRCGVARGSDEALDQRSRHGGREERAAPATIRIAATSWSPGASLSRKPLAPARSAPSTNASLSNVVSTSTRGGCVSVDDDPPRGVDPVEAPACGRPSARRPASRRVARATASSPSARLADGVHVGPRAWRIIRKPAGRAPGRRRGGRGSRADRERQARPNCEPPALARARSDLAAEQETRSRMPVRPWPRMAAAASASCRRRRRRSPGELLRRRIPRTTRARAGAACLSAFVRASWAIRYAERSTPGGSVSAFPTTTTSTGSPASRICAASVSS